MTVVLGFDESPGADNALGAALIVARRFEEDLVLVYGIAPPGSMGEEFIAHEEAIVEQARPFLDAAVERAAAEGVTTHVELLSAKPVDAILQAADKHDATVIVVGTWGESPMRGAILGSTPHKLLHLSTRPVLCVPAPEES